MKGVYRWLLPLAVAMIMPVAAEGQSRKGQKSVGLRGGYVTRNESAAAGLYFQYSFSDWFRLSPNIDYVFRNNNQDAFSFNFNAQFPLSVAHSEKCYIYPLAGLSYVAWSRHHDDPDLDNNDDVTTRDSRFGLNAGAGVEYFVTPTLKLGLEGRFQLVKHHNSGYFTLGIGYVF